MNSDLNVLGTQLVQCGIDPMTGFFRDGYCSTCYEDTGIHTVCIVATASFLEYSKSSGNDLSTPNAEFEFPGVKPGDSWCLCAGRWLEAYHGGFAPPVILEATHEETLAIIALPLLKDFAFKQK